MSKASPARRQKKATEAVVRREVEKAKRNHTILVSRAELDDLLKKVNEGFKMLSQNQENLGKNINQNLSAIMGAFQFTDAHLHVSRRILNDTAMGRLRMLVAESNGEETLEGIDYDWYHGQYQLTRGVVLFFQWMRKVLGMTDKPAVKAGEAEEPVEQMHDVEDFVFGGDYASQNAAPG